MLAGIPSASPLPSGRISFSPLHETDIRAATTAVRGRVNLAGWDHERGCSTDIHSLSPSWRVSVIAGNPVFSLLDRCRAFPSSPTNSPPSSAGAVGDPGRSRRHPDRDPPADGTHPPLCSCVRGNRKLRDYKTYYQFTLKEYRHHLGGGWLGEFHIWAGRCVTHRFGWCLDPRPRIRAGATKSWMKTV